MYRQFVGDCNMTDKYGNTILHLAVAANRLDLVERALEIGTNPWIENRQGKIALEIAVMKHDLKMTELLYSYMKVDKGKRKS